MIVSCVAIFTAGAVDKHSQTKLLAWMGAVRKKLDCQLCGNLHSWHSGQAQPGEAIGTDRALRGKSLLVSCVTIFTAGTVANHSQAKLLALAGR